MKYEIKHPKVTLVVRILLGVFMFGTGAMGAYSAIVGAPMPPMDNVALVNLMAALAATGWIVPWVMLFKVVAGVLLFIPRTAPLATLMCVPFFANILLYTLFTAPEYLVMGGVFSAFTAWLVYAYFDRYKPIFN